MKDLLYIERHPRSAMPRLPALLPARLLLLGALCLAGTSRAQPVPLPGLEPVTFLFASARLLPESRAALLRLADTLRAHPGMVVALHGHADPATETAFGDPLARERAETVFSFLLDQGVPAEALTLFAVGTRRPVGGDTFEGRRRNRRVAFVLPSPPPARPAATATPRAQQPGPLPPAAPIDPADGGWTVVVATAPTYQEAERLLDGFRALGYPVDVLRTLSREEKHFYVGLGQFFVREHAEEALRALSGRIPPGSRLTLLSPGM